MICAARKFRSETYDLRCAQVQIGINEQNKINLIVEQNKYFNYYENKNVFKKK